MHDLLAKAVEAAVAAGQPRAELLVITRYQDGECTLSDDGHVVLTGAEAECNMLADRLIAEDALRAALPGILEAVVGVVATERQAFQSPEYAFPQPLGSLSECFACNQIEAAQRALVAQVLEDGK